ncbi:hypothetical protein ACP4OV_027370 [Aristida adscensionis]
MEGSIGGGVCRSARTSCWTRRRGYHYQRLPAAPATPRQPAGRGVKLGRRTVLGSAARRLGGRLRGANKLPWPSPMQLLNRMVDTYISSMLSHPIKTVKEGVSLSSPSAAAAAEPVVSCEAASASSASPPRLRRGASSSRRGEVHGRGVMLNICVAEVLLLRRSSSEVRRSPLRQRKDAPTRSASVRA